MEQPDAPRIWYKTIANYLSELGFTKCARESCLFQQGSTGVIFMIYVDDLAVAGPTKSKVDEVISSLKDKFKMREMGLPSVFLGINVHHFPLQRMIFINQSTYIQKLVDKYGLEKEFHRSTTTAATVQLEPV